MEVVYSHYVGRCFIVEVFFKKNAFSSLFSDIITVVVLVMSFFIWLINALWETNCQLTQKLIFYNLQ